MDTKKLREYLELMKADIYYLSNKVSQIDSNTKIKETNKNSLDLEIKILRQKQDEMVELFKKVENRITNLELNQEHTSDYIEDVDSKFMKLQQAIINHSKQKEESKNEYSNNNMVEKVRDIENHFNEEIRRVYDNVFNEILNLKGEVNKIKDKSSKNDK